MKNAAPKTETFPPFVLAYNAAQAEVERVSAELQRAGAKCDKIRARAKRAAYFGEVVKPLEEAFVAACEARNGALDAMREGWRALDAAAKKKPLFAALPVGGGRGPTSKPPSLAESAGRGLRALRGPKGPASRKVSMRLTRIAVLLVSLASLGLVSAQAIGSEADDDGCTKTKCASSPPGIVVGTNDLENPACSAADSVVSRVSDSVAWYVRGDTGQVCTAVLLTHDNKLIVPLACLSATSALGTAYFGVYPANTRCRPQGAASVGDPYPAIAEGQFINFLEELSIVQLGPRASDGTFATQNHSLVRVGQPSTWGLGNGLLASDSLVYAGAQASYVLADPSCNRVNAPLSGGIGRTDCDTDAPLPGVVDPGFGGPIVYGENGCVPSGPGGACAPGTGPQSAGAVPGRLIGLMHRPSQASPLDMKYLSMARLTSPTGFLTQSGVMTSGNFDPLAY